MAGAIIVPASAAMGMAPLMACPAAIALDGAMVVAAIVGAAIAEALVMLVVDGIVSDGLSQAQKKRSAATLKWRVFMGIAFGSDR